MDEERKNTKEGMTGSEVGGINCRIQKSLATGRHVMVCMRSYKIHVMPDLPGQQCPIRPPPLSPHNQHNPNCPLSIILTAISQPHQAISKLVSGGSNYVQWCLRALVSQLRALVSPLRAEVSQLRTLVSQLRALNSQLRALKSQLRTLVSQLRAL